MYCFHCAAWYGEESHAARMHTLFKKTTSKIHLHVHIPIKKRKRNKYSDIIGRWNLFVHNNSSINERPENDDYYGAVKQ